LADFLVDANVLSEATKPRPTASVVDWLRRNEGGLVVNPIVLGELEYGILLLPAGRRRARLEKWFAEGMKRLPVLDLDAETARIWAGLLSELKRKGRAMPIKDSLIASTARQYRLTVATRNTDDYLHAGVRLVNPFKP
jgi:predicted nucleic acid-binding protein